MTYKYLAAGVSKHIQAIVCPHYKVY